MDEHKDRIDAINEHLKNVLQELQHTQVIIIIYRPRARVIRKNVTRKDDYIIPRSNIMSNLAILNILYCTEAIIPQSQQFLVPLLLSALF